MIKENGLHYCGGSVSFSLSRMKCSCSSRLVDGLNHLTNFHFLARLDLDPDNSASRRRDFGRDLVGFEHQNWFAVLDQLTILLEPGGKESGGNQLADCGNLNFDIHAKIALLLG